MNTFSKKKLNNDSVSLRNWLYCKFSGQFFWKSVHLIGVLSNPLNVIFVSVWTQLDEIWKIPVKRYPSLTRGALMVWYPMVEGILVVCHTWTKEIARLSKHSIEALLRSMVNDRYAPSFIYVVVWTVNHSKLECCKNCNEICTCPDYYLCLLILNIFAVVEV